MRELSLVDVCGEVDRLRAQLGELIGGLTGEVAAVLVDTDATLAVVQQELRIQKESLANAEVRLQDSRTQQEQLWSMLPLPSLRTDDAGRILTANAAATSLFGMSAPQLQRLPLAQFVDPAEHGLLRTAAQRAGHEGRAQGLLVTLRGQPPVTRQVLALPEPWGSVRMIRWTLLPPLPGVNASNAAATGVLQHRAYLCDLDWLRSALETRDLAELHRVAHGILPPGHGVQFAIVRGDPDVAPAAAGPRNTGQLPPGTADPARDAFRSRSPRLVADFSGPGQPHAILALPLIARDDVLGVLVAWAPTTEAFSPTVRYVLNLVAMIGATVITHAEDLDLLRDMLMDLRLQNP